MRVFSRRLDLSNAGTFYRQSGPAYPTSLWVMGFAAHHSGGAVCRGGLEVGFANGSTLHGDVLYPGARGAANVGNCG